MKEETYKKELTIIRNKLYDNLPTGEVSAFDLTTVIQLHLRELDLFIDQIQPVTAKTEQENLPLQNLKQSSSESFYKEQEKPSEQRKPFDSHTKIGWDVVKDQNEKAFKDTLEAVKKSMEKPSEAIAKEEITEQSAEGDLKIKILSKISKEGIGTLMVMMKEEPNEFRFSITEVYTAMEEYASQKHLPTDEDIRKEGKDYFGEEWHTEPNIQLAWMECGKWMKEQIK